MHYAPLMPGFWNGAITNRPVKSSVAIETLESNQSHYMIFAFIGELTNWPDKIVSRNRALDNPPIQCLNQPVTSK
jgi:hypothetical protein